MARLGLRPGRSASPGQIRTEPVTSRTRVRPKMAPKEMAPGINLLALDPVDEGVRHDVEVALAEGGGSGTEVKVLGGGSRTTPFIPLGEDGPFEDGGGGLLPDGRRRSGIAI